MIPRLYLIALFLNITPMMAQTPIRYVALGDSYTICTGAQKNESWPLLLSLHLGENKIPTQLIANPSHNGWTTQDLIEKELPILDRSNATFVTLLIGVNDWVRGRDEATFSNNLITIIDHIQKELPDKKMLLLITIPDFGVTPVGAGYANGRNISKGIEAFNTIIKAEAKKRGLSFVDLFELSKEMGKDATLVATDGLHPSAKEYAIWEKQIYPIAFKMLERK